ncbi:MAG: hypothetical protein ACKO8Z_18130, partial [Prosthecobacter sp.]
LANAKGPRSKACGSERGADIIDALEHRRGDDSGGNWPAVVVAQAAVVSVGRVQRLYGLQRCFPPRRCLSLALCGGRCGLRESVASMMMLREAGASDGQAASWGAAGNRPPVRLWSVWGAGGSHSLASASLLFAVMATTILVSLLPQGIIHTF